MRSLLQSHSNHRATPLTESHQGPRRGTVARHGLDIVDITQFDRLLRDRASIFLDRHFAEAGRPMPAKDELVGAQEFRKAIVAS